MNPYSYQIKDVWQAEIDDIDGKTRRANVSYEGTQIEGELRIHTLSIVAIDNFYMSAKDLLLSVTEGLYLIDPRTVIECKSEIKGL